MNFEPKKRVGEDLLARKLEHVSIHGVSSFDAALSVFEQAKIEVGFTRHGDPQYAHIDLELNNVSVREALNAIAKADGLAMWTFIPYPEKNMGTLSMGSWRYSGEIRARDVKKKSK